MKTERHTTRWRLRRALIIVNGSAYLGGAFGAWSLNPGDWGSLARLGTLVVMAGLSLTVLVVWTRARREEDERQS